jgi:hypothetical protein
VYTFSQRSPRRASLLMASLSACLMLAGAAVCIVASFPSAAMAERDEPSITAEAVMKASPEPGAAGIRPGSLVTVSLQDLPAASKDERREVASGRFRCFVYQYGSDDRCLMTVLEPGNGCYYDAATDSVCATIADMKPFTQYFVLFSTSYSYKPRIYPLDPGGQQIILRNPADTVQFFGTAGNRLVSRRSLTFKGVLRPGDRLVQMGRNEAGPIYRRLDPYLLSTVFSTGPEPGLAETVVVSGPDSVSLSSLASIDVTVLDGYKNPSSCYLRLSFLERGRVPGSASIRAEEVLVGPGRIRFGLSDTEPELVEIRAAASLGDREVISTKTVAFGVVER